MVLDIVASGRWNVGAVVVFSGLLAPTSISPQNNRTGAIIAAASARVGADIDVVTIDMPLSKTPFMSRRVSDNMI